jgi:hypothetical protein
MSIESPDLDPRQNQEPASVGNAEVGYTIPETQQLAAEPSDLTRWERVKRDGAELWRVIRTADEADMIRGMSNQF